MQEASTNLPPANPFLVGVTASFDLAESNQGMALDQKDVCHNHRPTCVESHLCKLYFPCRYRISFEPDSPLLSRPCPVALGVDDDVVDDLACGWMVGDFSLGARVSTSENKFRPQVSGL